MRLIAKRASRAASSLVVRCLSTGIAGVAGVMGVMGVLGAMAAPAPVQAQTAVGVVSDLATQGAALVKSKNCLGCHLVDAKRVGPGFTSIAKRYSAIDQPQAYLASSLQRGGGGRWGAVPMPAQTQVSDAEAQQIAAWILSLDHQ